MLLNYKLFFKYIYFNQTVLFFKTVFWNTPQIGLVLNKQDLYYTALFLKMSSLFYPIQLIDIFTYEHPTNLNSTKIGPKDVNSSIVVYNFQNILTQKRFFIFTLNRATPSKPSRLNSITSLFPNANWLEREAGEMTGTFFYGKRDIRNLMLPYGDNSSPLIKVNPAVGFREIYYDSINDILIQSPVSIQF